VGRTHELNLNTIAAIAAMAIGACLLAVGAWTNLQQHPLTMQFEAVDVLGADFSETEVDQWQWRPEEALDGMDIGWLGCSLWGR
jgi:hypothetical protein